MSQENKDQIADQTQPESSTADDLIHFDPKPELTEDTPKEPENVAQDTVNEMSDNSNDTQMVAETFQIAKDIDKSVVEDTPDHQPSMYPQVTATNEGSVDNEDENGASEDRAADEDQSLDAEAGDPIASSATTESADDDLSADKEADARNENKDTRSSKENSDDNKEDVSHTETKSDDSSELDGSISSSEDEDLSEAKQNDVLDSAAENDPSAQNPDDIMEETEDLPEFGPKKKIPFAKAAMTVIIVAALFSGFIVFDNKSNIKSAQKEKSKEAIKTLSSQASQDKLKPTIQPDDPNYIYYTKIDEISALRDTLLHKNEEIMTLKNRYQSGIEELEKEILDELQQADSITFLEAIENKRIEFTLRTIQRRQAYIRELDRPAQWVFQAAEDLLYIKRKALMDIQVAEIASGIDMNMHVRHMNTALNKYRPTADKLAIDMTDAPSESLESIWQGIQNKRLTDMSHRAHSKNQIILEQICTGNFSRLAELSEISVDSAKCIVEKQGSDLFLNGLTEISPSAARHLFQWKGNWICLNGFRALSPRVAAYLFEWEGRWISLNGLTDFPPEIGTLLLQWQGNQLELMGLRYTDDSAAKIGIKYLAEWERSGGKLFVPQTIRKKIDEINGSRA